MYFLGIDGGGTKTDAVVTDKSQRVLGQAKTGAANYRNVGLSRSVAAVHEATRLALREAKIRPDQLTGSVLGLASFDTPKDQKILSQAFIGSQAAYFVPHLTIVNDTIVGFYSGAKPPGVCLVAGTGCNCYGIGADGREAFAGNWSYLLGDEGGGYQVALQILGAVIRSFDGRGAQTILRDLVLTKLALQHEYELVDWLYETRPNPTEVASLASLLDQALQNRDSVAEGIFYKQVNELAADVFAVAGRVGLTGEFPLVLIGSFFTMERWVSALKDRVQKRFPAAQFISPRISPAMGATIMAQDIAQKNGR